MSRAGDKMTMGNQRPRISIVTPSYNQGHYIDDTIQSVLFQGYPNLEYMIFDGGSTDQTCEVISQYESQLAYWVSARDKGQADAINRGFARSTGDILGWLNSDDMYLPGTLKKVERIMSSVGDEPTIVFGNSMHLVEETHGAFGSHVEREHQILDLELADYIIQPSSFWNRQVHDLVGPLSEELHFGFDWEWFIRAKRAGVKFVPVDDFFSVYRIHSGHKTGAGGEKRLHELAEIYRRFHCERVAKGYLDLKSSRLARYAYIFADKSRLNRLVDINRLVHALLFSSLSWKEFNNIRRM